MKKSAAFMLLLILSVLLTVTSSALTCELGHEAKSVDTKIVFTNDTNAVLRMQQVAVYMCPTCHASGTKTIATSLAPAHTVCSLGHPADYLETPEPYCIGYSKLGHIVQHRVVISCATCNASETIIRSTENQEHTLDAQGVCTLCFWGSETPNTSPYTYCILGHEAEYAGLDSAYVSKNKSLHYLEQRKLYSCASCNAYGYRTTSTTELPHTFSYKDTGHTQDVHHYRAICTDCLYGMDVVLPCTGEPHAVPVS